MPAISQDLTIVASDNSVIADLINIYMRRLNTGRLEVPPTFLHLGASAKTSARYKQYSHEFHASSLLLYTQLVCFHCNCYTQLIRARLLLAF